MNSFPMNSPDISPAEFEEFINLFAHELRNRLNMISLEASDLAEQLEDTGVDDSRLQNRVRDCSEFLRCLRDQLAPENPASRRPLAEIMDGLRPRRES